MPGLTGFITITGSKKYPRGLKQEREKKENPPKGPSRKTEEVDRRGNTMGVHFEAGRVPAIAAALSNACTSVC